MQNRDRQSKIKRSIEIAVIALFCAFVIALDFIDISIVKDTFRSRMLIGVIQQACGSFVAIWCALRFSIRLFGKVEKGIYLLPCLIIAVNNMQWWAFFSGKMQLLRTEWIDVLLFALYTLLTGLFEEVIFRGILFSLLAGVFSKDRKGFLWTTVLSSFIFGLAHLFNGFSLGTLLQVGYSVLTGGLFAFCLAKTKNLFCCALTHGVYNFCGLLMDERGLGSGAVFDLGTIISMASVAVIVGIFVAYKLWKYPEAEREVLYEKLNVKNKE